MFRNQYLIFLVILSIFDILSHIHCRYLFPYDSVYKAEPIFFNAYKMHHMKICDSQKFCFLNVILIFLFFQRRQKLLIKLWKYFKGTVCNFVTISLSAQYSYCISFFKNVFHFEYTLLLRNCVRSMTFLMYFISYFN